MAKRTGLGRGIGALIPTSEPNESRPVDVFFPDNNASNKAADAAAKAAAEEAAQEALTPAKPAAKKPAARKPAAKAPKVAEKAEQAAADDLVPVPGLTLIQVDPNAIVPNPRQPRTVFDAEDLAELVHSVREFGVLQPVVVRTAPGGTGYELIMGERRTRAAREAGLATIPAIVRETDDVDLLRDALLENLHRSELNPLEEASAYQQLLDDFGITHEELASRIGRSRPQVSNTLRLLKLPVAVQQRVAAGVLSAGHARAILSLDSPEAMSRLADKIVNEDLSVRAAESAAKTIEGSTGRATKPHAGARRAFLDDVATRLGDRLNTRVKIALGARKGQVSIEFASIQDLNRILGELGEDEFGAAK